jgi:hypothetical protein
LDNTQNYSKVKNVDAQVPTQDFARSIGIGKEGGKIIELSHDAGMSAKVKEGQAAGKAGKKVEGVTLREALRRPSTILKPWAKPNGDSRGAL